MFILQVTATWEGTKLVQTYIAKDHDGKPRKTTRYFKDGEIVQVSILLSLSNVSFAYLKVLYTY